MQVIGSLFEGAGKEGDFGWMLTQPRYDDALFVFNDNEEQFQAFLDDQTPGNFGCRAGAGNAEIRPYRCQSPPRAAGVPTGGSGSGYSELTPEAKRVIDRAFDVIDELLVSVRYQRVFYSAASAAGDLGTGTFEVGDDVKRYIVDRLQALSG